MRTYFAKIPMLLLFAIFIARIVMPEVAIAVFKPYFWVLYSYTLLMIARFIWCVCSYPKWEREQAEQTNKPHNYTAKHLVIITIYKEPVDVIIETLEVLASTTSASRMTIALAMEERDPDHKQRAK